MDDVEGTGQNNFKSLTLDVDYYQSFLDDADIPEDKRRELIETLWQIVVNFIDLGFGIHPLQQSGQKVAIAEGDPEQLGRHPAVIKMIEQAVNENAGTDNQQAQLKEAWPERDNA